MIYPSLTAAYLAILALIYIAMSAWVVRLRYRYRKPFGDGAHKPLIVAIRAHANFIEYVPLAVLLVGALEMQGASGTLVHSLLVTLLAARLAHAYGLHRPAGSRQHLPIRALGMSGTWAVMAAATVLLLTNA